MKNGTTDAIRYKAPNGEPIAWIYRNKDRSDHECIPWPYARYSNGYGMINTADRKCMTASRFMCEVAHGSPPKKRMDAAHLCGNGHLACCNPSHLTWTSRSVNLSHRAQHGTLPRGESHIMSRLTEDQVLEIRRLRDDLTQREIGVMFGVSPQTVSEIQLRKKWVHLHG